MLVFFETSTLVAASIRALEGSIQHSRYSESKGLVNQAAKREILGITTFNIEEQANNALEKALLDVMELNKPPETIEEFRNYSTILDAIQRMYLENISFLDRLSTDKDEVVRIEEEEVYPMYEALDANVREPPEKVYTISPKFMRTANYVNRIVFGRYKQTMKRLDEKSIIPDSYDRTILSEAVYLKRNRFQKQRFCLASLDNHFCGFKTPYTEIPEKIKELFYIECLSPSNIIPLIKKK
jgi:hypothetical protein